MNDTLLKNFLRISRIPRMTGNEKEISDFFVDIAKNNGLEYYQDKYYNVLIKKKGNINKPSICLQTHLDMVCVKTNDSKHDFTKDGINVIIDGDKVTAKDTSLGADQGVGLAVMLTIMEDKSIIHPDLEFFFTVEEETTFKGVINFDYHKLNSKELINLDYCKDNSVVIGSAGDVVNEYIFKSKLEKRNLPSYKIIIDGFKSGNSGENILESKDNAIITIARLLKDKEVYIKSINGGTFENDLATSCEVILQTNLDINNLSPKFKIEKIENDESFSLEDTNNIINEILSLKGGYLSNTASANLGMIRTTDKEIKITYLIRSTILEEIEAISNETKIIKYNFKCNKLYKDSIWKPDNESKLLQKYKEVYFNMFNEYPLEVICQGGVESGSIKKRVGDIDVISIGANINDFHSTNEITYISSWKKVYTLLLELFKY